MTELEYLEVGILSGDLTGTAIMNFVTVVFAYTLMSHFVGKGLPNSLAVGASIIYSFWLIGPLSGVVGGVVAHSGNSS